MLDIHGQMDLFRPIREPKTPKGASLETRFTFFDIANPHVYRAIVAKARAMQARGVERWSINGIFEVLRWETRMETLGDEGWKLNNSYRALYARMVMECNSDLDGFFETRERQNGEEAAA